MSKIILTILTVFTIVSTQAQTKKNVENLCGCFEVEFKYAETFSPDPKYKYHDREEISAGLELVLPIENTDKKIVMQHLLVVTDSMIVKHWRDDWTYENPVRYKYTGNKTWVKENLSAAQVKGKWTQSVWEVSDEPRYQGSSDWITLDGKPTWVNTTDAPLPRREYSVRSDYNILQRTNKIMITKDGWLHEQDNKKIIREGNTDKLLVEEKGFNTYKRVDDSRCAAAKAYWEKNKTYWAKVRAVWDEYIAKNNTIQLKTKVDGKVLNEYLFALAKDYSTGKITAADIDSKIKEQIYQFFGAENKTLAAVK